MENKELESRIEHLEARLMHLEAALEELTRTLLAQEAKLGTQAETIRQLEHLLQGLVDAGIMAAGKEPPPPHY